MIADRLIDMLDRSLHHDSNCCEQRLEGKAAPKQCHHECPFECTLILSLIQSSVDERPTLCYPLSVDTKYILLINDEQLG